VHRQITWERIGIEMGIIQTIDSQTLDKLSKQAASNERRRLNLNTHPSSESVVQRLFNAFEPNTYIRPHRHSEPHKWEFMLLLAGRLDVVIFDEAGTLRERVHLALDAIRACEIPAGTWHSFVSLEPGTLVFEVKEGTFTPTPETDFAGWAPAEQSPECLALLKWMVMGDVGSSFRSRSCET
jgi:cupin fold WbuC family metalloprotein